MMDRMMAMHAPICTTRLLPTRVNCRHPIFSLSAGHLQEFKLSNFRHAYQGSNISHPLAEACSTFDIIT